MFKRKHAEATVPPIPEVVEATAKPRTTCYPQDPDGVAPVLGQPRTTTYRQSASWNRGGYDTVN